MPVRNFNANNVLIYDCGSTASCEKNYTNKKERSTILTLYDSCRFYQSLSLQSMLLELYQVSAPMSRYWPLQFPAAPYNNKQDGLYNNYHAQHVQNFTFYE